MPEQEVPSRLALLLERIQGQEALDLEFKAARGGLPREVWPTVSAFANTQGGWLMLGIGERDGQVFVDGLPNARGLVSNFYDLLRNEQKISHCICGSNDVSIEQIEGKEVVVIRVPAAPRKSRPVYINGNPYSGTYVRRQSGDYHCTKPEVDRMMREASDAGADSAILKNFGLEDLDQDALARYRRRYQTLNPASPWTGYDDARFLRAVGGIRKDRETAAEGITVAALLMFGTSAALRDWRGRHLIDYRLVSPEQGDDTRWLDRLAWDGNLLGAFETIYPKLIEGQRVPFRLEGGIRVDESSVHVALREALVNLLIHADYTEPTPSLIKHSSEGVLFRNPGSSRVSEVDLRTGDRSDPRNPQLAFMFRQVGLAEEAGTGIPKILRTWRELGFHLPGIHTDTERYEFTLELRHVHLLSDEDREWLRSLGDNWGETEQLALLIARQDGEVDNLTVRTLTGQHPSDVTKVLGLLRDRGFLRMVGAKRGARYQLGIQALARAESGKESEQSPIRPESTNLPERSTNLVQNSANLAENSAKLDEERPAGIGDEVWSELLDISKLARERKYLDADVRDQIIVALCERAPLSLQDLVRLTSRSPALIRQSLATLVRERRLTLIYPNQPNHPRQRYTGQGTPR